jgi:inner membrane protein YidH
MPAPITSTSEPQPSNQIRLANDHLANERTFLAVIRTGIALVVFGFAIGRFAVAIREFMQLQGRTSQSAGMTVWAGMVAMLGGVVLTLTGLFRYRRTRAQLEAGYFQPAGFVIDLVAILTALFGLALAAYLLFIGLHL